MVKHQTETTKTMNERGWFAVTLGDNAEIRAAFVEMCRKDRRTGGSQIAWLIEQEVARRAAAKGGAS